jgi:hypothetical protein
VHVAGAEARGDPDPDRRHAAGGHVELDPLLDDRAVAVQRDVAAVERGHRWRARAAPGAGGAGGEPGDHAERASREERGPRHRHHV